MRLLLACFAALTTMPLAGAVPEQVHLSVVGEAEGRPVFAANWLDGLPEVACPSAQPAGVRASPAELVPGPSAGWVYEQRFTLEPGAGEYAVCGRTFALRAPAPPTEERPLRIVALGDMGTGAQAAATVQAVLDLDPDLVLHAGDLSYAQGDPALWKAWFQLVEPAAATRPWMVALGNHETYTGGVEDPWVQTGQASPLELAFWHQRFALPGNELWFSFDWAGVHVIALDTFTASGGVDEGPLPEGEAAWLEADLRAHADAPWTIVFLHQPPYSSAAAHGDSPRVQEAFVPLFEQYGVDLVVGGHDHTYERSFPLRGGAPVQAHARDYRAGDGVLYLVTGGAGRSLYELAEEQPAWSAARASVYHVTLLEVTPTELRGRVVPTAGDDGADAFRLAKDAAPPEASPRAVSAVPVALLLLAAAILARRR